MKDFVTCNYCKRDLSELRPSSYQMCPSCGGTSFTIETRPKIICYCGSLRFKTTFQQVEYQSVIEGEIALLPCCMFVDIQRIHGEFSTYKVQADELHKRKIDLCDEVFVLNVGGYIGESTRSEIDYALSNNKPVKYLES